ncbi:DUF934 domain-containing protein [Minwuia sp.]|uniref:DUF934 domain-containing protein n=1 Tax=Minwuia sp. TaxID=2493630 RepID=UPI003A8C9DAA
MALLKNGKLLQDRWETAETVEEALKPGAKFVSLDLWLAERGLLRGLGAIGVILPNDADPGVLVDDLDRIAAISLSFPAFTDGRAFSQARILRDRYGFGGELRANGPVIADQYSFLLRCGFDAVVVSADIHLETWLGAAQRFRSVYQPAADDRVPAYRLRHAAPVALAS